MFTSIGAHGHLRPLLPLAHALREAGHEVAIATAASFDAEVERSGFELLPAGITTDEARSALSRSDLALPARERAERIVVKLFVDAIARATLAELPRLVGWRPDLVVREEGEFAGPIVAAKAGVPWVDVGWGPMRPPALVAAAATALEPLWREHGLAPDPAGGTYRWLYLDPCPPSLQLPWAAGVTVAHPVWLQDAPVPAAATGTSARATGARPLVYVTLGTVARFAGDLAFFAMAIEALAPDFELLITLGPEGRLEALGTLPEGVRALRFVPQDRVLPRCALVISNGGAGSMLGALSYGVPVLAVPADSPSQQRNADALDASGAGRRIERAALTAPRLRDAVALLLRDPRARTMAQRIAAEIRAMPRAADAVAWLERLAFEGRPLVAVPQRNQTPV